MTLKLKVICVCGKSHRLADGKRRRCECGALVWHRRWTPWVRLEDDWAGRQILRRPALSPKQIIMLEVAQ